MGSITALYDKAMEATTQDEADVILEQIVECACRISPQQLREEHERIQRSNLGYYAGYYSHEVRERVERLFDTEHPIFGKIAVNGPPTTKQAFELGRRMGEQAREKWLTK